MFMGLVSSFKRSSFKGFPTSWQPSGMRKEVCLLGLAIARGRPGRSSLPFEVMISNELMVLGLADVLRQHSGNRAFYTKMSSNHHLSFTPANLDYKQPSRFLILHSAFLILPLCHVPLARHKTVPPRHTWHTFPPFSRLQINIYISYYKPLKNNFTPWHTSAPLLHGSTKQKQERTTKNII
jgi:hypothetical protein